MKAWTKTPFATGRAAICAALVAMAVPAPAVAQVDSRLERIEREIGALQRAVFPGGDERFFEPEITAQAGTPANTGGGQVATSALTDVLARLDSIEGQLARLTAATEVNQNALSSLEMRLIALEARATAASETVTTSAPSSTGSSTGSASTGVIDPPSGNRTVDVAIDNRPTPPAAQSSGPSSARVAAVQAIAKPATGDAGDDEYVYGFRLWDAGFYPEAQQQLSLFLEAYPNHRRTSFGRNLLGRAYLDAGDPETASRYFLANYNDDATGARAPHSLLYLAEARIQVEDTRRACIALAVFGEEFPALAAGELQGQYDNLRGRVDCD